jgi:hypothetical protein
MYHLLQYKKICLAPHSVRLPTCFSYNSNKKHKLFLYKIFASFVIVVDTESVFCEIGTECLSANITEIKVGPHLVPSSLCYLSFVSFQRVN